MFNGRRSSSLRSPSSLLQPASQEIPSTAMDQHFPYNNAALERRLIDEVRYLHSLWHRGPDSNPNPNLRPLTLTSFKKNRKETTAKKKGKKQRENEAENDDNILNSCEKNNRRKKKGEKQRQNQTEKDENGTPPFPDSKWDIGLPPERLIQTGWGEYTPHDVGPSTRPATAEEQAKLVAVHLQRSALNLCRDFFSKKDSVDSEEDDEDDWDDMEVDGEGESDRFEFFLRLFTDDDDLRIYYEKNFERGLFVCLACEGIGEKVGKKFGDCVALVQHSVAISKTKGKIAHRAFGKAICRVLGWNINRLPSIVLDLGKTLGQSLAKPKSEAECLQENDDGNQEKSSLPTEANGTSDSETNSQSVDKHVQTAENNYVFDVERTSEAAENNDASDLEITSQAIDSERTLEAAENSDASDLERTLQAIDSVETDEES